MSVYSCPKGDSIETDSPGTMLWRTSLSKAVPAKPMNIITIPTCTMYPPHRPRFLRTRCRKAVNGFSSSIRARARVPFQNSTTMIVSTKAPSAKVKRAYVCRTPAEKRMAAAEMNTAPGKRKFRLRFRGLAFRQAMTGPIPISMSRTRPIGILTWLKKGGPTEIFDPVSPSVSSGNMVPQITAKVTPRRTRLFRRNADSRESKDSNCRSLLRSGSRQIMRISANAPVTPMHPRKIHAIVRFCANEWTDSISPDRVRNVAKIVMRKVTTTSPMFHTFSIPRLFWIITECRKAVATSQGRSDAFSTGSQNQKPPHPSSS